MEGQLQLSIAICTFNRGDVLKLCLDSLKAQTVPNSEFEVIIVDNNSTDNTPQLVNEYVCEKDSPFIYVQEKKVGLSHARNHVIEIARSPYVAYLDDDAIAPKNWIEVALKIIEDEKPDAYGGPYKPFYLSPKPKWFLDRYVSYYPRDFAGNLGKQEYLPGNNMIIKKEHLVELKGFNPNLGMTGYKVAYSEETDFFDRLKKKRPSCRFWYEPDLCIKHLAPIRKMQWSWILKNRWAHGRDITPIYEGIKKTNSLGFMKRFLWILKMTLSSLIIAIFKRDKSRYPNWQNYLYEDTSHYLRRLGYLWVCFNKKQ
ncbi:MAG: glycosyltransferase [Opitutales bacterium]|nr:glycosyltransferase [Opitutales bacterium]